MYASKATKRGNKKGVLPNTEILMINCNCQCKLYMSKILVK